MLASDATHPVALSAGFFLRFRETTVKDAVTVAKDLLVELEADGTVKHQRFCEVLRNLLAVVEVGS